MENTDLVSLGGEISKDKERPIKVAFWKEAPVGDTDMATRDRLAEFFRAPQVPNDLKPLGILAQEPILQTAKEIENQNFQIALYNKGPFAGKPTIYALQLFKDRLNIAMSPIGNYPNFALEVTSIPTNVLDKLTGGVSKDLALELPNEINILLSSESSKEVKSKAKLALMRYLAIKRPEETKGINESLMPATGIVYTPDGQNAIVKMYIHEIPEDDPVLGETMKFYNAIKIYKDVEVMLTKDELLNMTVGKIENFLKNLNPKLQKVLMGNHPQYGFKAWRIFQFFEKFGFKGNSEQQKWKKSERMSMGLHSFSDKLRVRILKTITEDKSFEESGLDNDALDKLFRENYKERRGVVNLPDDFSITDIIMNKVPLSKVKL